MPEVNPVEIIRCLFPLINIAGAALLGIAALYKVGSVISHYRSKNADSSSYTIRNLPYRNKK